MDAPAGLFQRVVPQITVGGAAEVTCELEEHAESKHGVNSSQIDMTIERTRRVKLNGIPRTLEARRQ